MISIPKWWFRGGAVLAAVVMLATLGLATVQTQEVGGFDVVVKPLHQLITKVDSVLAVVKPAPGRVVLSTALSGGTSFACYAVNMTEADLSVTFRLINSDGSELFNFTEVVSPGTGHGIGKDILRTARCEFSFNGSPSDVRANMHSVWITFDPLLRNQSYLDAR